MLGHHRPPAFNVVLILSPPIKKSMSELDTCRYHKQMICLNKVAVFVGYEGVCSKLIQSHISINCVATCGLKLCIQHVTLIHLSDQVGLINTWWKRTQDIAPK